MKNMMRGFLSVILLLVLAGCGGGDGSRQTFVTQILSDAAFDGDIARDPLTGGYTVAQGGTQSVFAGVSPVSGLEYRAFLDFPLTGAGGVPGDAIIRSAFLDIVINSIAPLPLPAPLPIRIDLVSFQPPTLIGTDYDRTIQPALATTTIVPPIGSGDFGQHVPVDVTVLMKEAQRLNLPHFQLRILLEESSPAHGLIEINDTTGGNRDLLAPLLEVEYY
jgi:hypothetical protein